MIRLRIHLDTDFAGNPDDAAALAMLAGWPDTELVGVTTVADPDGRRARYVRRMLSMLGLDGVPVASGAGVSMTTGRRMGGLPDHERYWGDIDLGAPARGGVLNLLRHNVEQGARLLATGPATNLAAFAREWSGSLQDTDVVLMGGWVDPPGEGLPAWGPEHDWNVQCDTTATQILTTAARLTLVPLAVTLRAQLRARDLPRLAGAGPVGRLLVRQAEAYAVDRGRRQLSSHDGVADDLLNFHHDPVAAAVAVGWDGVRCRHELLRPVLRDSLLEFERSPDGVPVRVAAEVDVEAFRDVWLSAVERAHR